jgi:hypothetical protein
VASLRDLLFGSGILKQAAAGPQQPAAPQPIPAGQTGIDVAAEAQKAAARAQAAPPPTVTPTAGAAPVKKNKLPTATAIGDALKQQ